ncbi:MAG: 2-hydroxyacyl-CoA dehydratase family protein [Deltaproteobacteria bacterium]|nr:2-hydroxyacyl-CoA dehydratase family protein [Deltaproteobacteria bacterium]
MELPTRKEILARVRGQGLRVAGVLPIHYPRALLRAYGFHPMEIWGPPGMEVHGGGGHFPEYTCAVARFAAAFLAAGGREAVDCVLVPHTCDSLQGAAAILRQVLGPARPVFTLYNPRGAGEAAEEFLARELAQLAGALGRLAAVSPTDAELHRAIDRENRADLVFNRMCRDRRAYAVDDRTFYTILRSREYLPPEDFCALEPPRGAAPGGVGVMLAGIVPEPMALFDLFAEHGALVAADDLACGSRRLYQPLDHPDPLRRLARQLLSKPPDPTAGHDVAARIAWVTRRLAESGARGLIVYNVKFCEPELFFLPLERQALEERGWPYLYLEESLPTTLSHQSRTRLEAFLEVLQ